MSHSHRSWVVTLALTLWTLVIGGCATDSEYREILSVSDITQNVIDPGTDPVVCDGFHLSTKQVMFYFKHAREVVSRTYTHAFDYAPCHVTGKLMLKSGITATWEINLGGTGSINFDDGQVKLLGCERCIPKQ